jgi:REP element-mobilizing transposase RayT
LVLNAIVAEAIEKYGARIHAFCWMTNHLHAVMQIAGTPLGRVVQRIAMRYSRYRHKQLRTTGHLFERRHRAFLIDVDTYFLALLRYVHLNPVEARMVTSPDEYPWSSHHAYLGVEVLPWLTTELGLGMLSRTFDGAYDAYRQFMQGKFDARETDEFKLLPSVDTRVIGTDRFLASLPPPRIKPRSHLTLVELGESVCASFQVRLDEVRSSARRRHLTKARITIARRAEDEGVASLREVARFLDRTSSAICQMLRRHDVG